MVSRYGPPFAYPGGKRRYAEQIWQRFGRPPAVDGGYAEPFFGGGAVLLANDRPFARELVNDRNGFVANFWRALRAAPDQVAYWADWPTVAQDYHARHYACIDWAAACAERVNADASYYDARIAGFWAYGAAGTMAGATFGAPGVELNVKPQLSVGPGGGRSIQAQATGAPVAEGSWPDGLRLRPWFRALAARLAKVIVYNQDWASLLRNRTALADYPRYDGAARRRILLDPPYQAKGHRYSGGGGAVAEQAYDWAIANGERYGIAYCMNAGDFPVPRGWEVISKHRAGMFGARGVTEQVIFSPACAADRPCQGLLVPPA